MTRAAKRRKPGTRVFDNRVGHPLKRGIKALRPHQWLKNLLVFVPLLMAHRFGEPELLGQAILAFLVTGVLDVVIVALCLRRPSGDDD